MRRRKLVKIAIIGYGYWGPNLVRNFVYNDDASVVYVCDKDKGKLLRIKKIYPQVKTVYKYQDVIEDPDVDGVVIATPPETHFKIAEKALKAGKNVLVEKPMTTKLSDAKELLRISKTKKLVLMVDHTFVYSKPIELIKEIIDKGKIGKVLNIDSSRISLGLFQNNINVIGDLATHDFSIIDYWFGKLPKGVVVSAIKSMKSPQEDQAFIHAYYPDGLVLNIHVSWLSPVKLRRINIVGTKKMIIYDDLESDEKVKIYDTSVSIKKTPGEIFQLRYGYRRGDIEVPRIEIKEPLSSMAEDFIISIVTKKKPRSDAESGLRVVKSLDMVTAALKKMER